MSRRLMREGLKALREATQSHTKLDYVLGSPTFKDSPLPPNHVLNRQIPRDEVNTMMNNKTDPTTGKAYDPIIPKDIMLLLKQPRRIPDGVIKAPKSPGKPPLSYRPPRRAPEGFADLFKRPSRKP